MNQEVCQNINQSINQNINQSINQNTNQRANQNTNQSANHDINQSINQKRKQRTKRPLLKRISVILSAILLTLLLAVFGINAYVKNATRNQIYTTADLEQISNLQDVDCIIVLGCRVYSDGSLSPMLKERLDAAKIVYETGVSKKLLLSGDHGRNEYNEVQAMKNYFLEEMEDNQLPTLTEQDLFMDHAGFSTYESIYRARDVFQVKKMIIVSHSYHLNRALYIANCLGIEAYGVGIEDDYSGNTMREAREILARDKDFVKCIFKPLPTYLGDVIDIHKDGNLTND